MTRKDDETHLPKPGIDYPVLLATKKTDPLLLAGQLLGLTKIERRDPEQPHWRIKREDEGTGDDPDAIVIEKIRRAKAGLAKENFGMEIPAMSSDVGFRLNGEQLHQIIRTPDDQAKFDAQPWLLDQLRLEIVEKYAQPFEAVWDVRFAVEDEQNNIYIAHIRIRARHEKGFSREVAYQNFNPRVNAGLYLVELLAKEGAVFEVLFDGEYDGIGQESPTISGEEAMRYIVHKIMDERIFWQFIMGKPENRQQIGLFSIAITQSVEMSDKPENRDLPQL